MTRSPIGHSADVRMQLNVGGRSLKLAQLGPGFAILALPADVPPGDAEIVLSIDGNERRWNVILPNGLSRDGTKLCFRSNSTGK